MPLATAAAALFRPRCTSFAALLMAFFTEFKSPLNNSSTCLGLGLAAVFAFFFAIGGILQVGIGLRFEVHTAQELIETRIGAQRIHARIDGDPQHVHHLLLPRPLENLE